jgi:hypothetical protein
MAQADIDLLKPERHLVDLYSHSDGDFGSADNVVLSETLGDILLVEYIDLVDEGGDFIERNGIAVPVNTLTSAWRKGKVLIVGKDAKHVKVGDLVTFPNNLGISVNKLPIIQKAINAFTFSPMVTKYVTKKATFLNEDRIFGICKSLPIEEGSYEVTLKNAE